MNRELRYSASLALNLVLAAGIVLLFLNKSKRMPVLSAADVNPKIKTASETPGMATQPKSSRYTDIASASNRRQWLIDQLRAAGVPNSVLARVVQSDLDEQWQKRFEEAGEKGHADADSMSRLQLEHDRSEDAEMRAALGEEGFKLWDQEKQLKEVNCGHLQFTTSEADALYDLKKQLQQRQWDLVQARLNGDMDEADANSASDKAYAEFNQQMKSLLGDERYTKSQGLDADSAATNLMFDLAKANPSDSQFQDLLKAQQEFNQRRSELDRKYQDDPSSADYADQVKALDAAHDQEYQRVLGTNVFDALQKSQDVGYTTMKKCETIWGLDDNKIDYVYGSLKYYEKSVEDYQAQAQALQAQGQNVDWDAVKKNLQQFGQQTQQSLQSYLGQDSFNKMQRNGVFQFNQ
ncbi:MAG TPA: hypothetical protein VKV04_10160 [Verrucomicrobiae bacterium]|nr:hypothetical protein [Verrucomicrobiae bacterium]